MKTTDRCVYVSLVCAGRTAAYMCPELFKYEGPRPTTAVDMFSYGVLTWCALHLMDTPRQLSKYGRLPLRSSCRSLQAPSCPDLQDRI